MQGKRFLVVPTCRPYGFIEFMSAWKGRGGWDKVILVEDAPERTAGLAGLVDYHYSHAEIEGILGRDAWIISRRDSAIRCFGFLAAYHLGASHVLTLDDDVRPQTGETDFFARHIDALSSHARWVSSIPGMRVRGLPYFNAGRLKDVVMSVGLWSGVPDLDAVCSLAHGVPTDFTPPDASWLIPHGQYAPLCGMNVAAERSALPLLYFGLMGEGQPYSRFDDIVMGLWAKKVCDHLGWSIRVGPPHIHHSRASDPLTNLRKEATGVGFLESFWEEVDTVRLPAYAIDAPSAMEELGSGLAERGSTDYVRRLGGALRVWAGLFSQPLALSESPREAAPVQT